MSSDETGAPTHTLQFDRVELPGGTNAAAHPAVTCGGCGSVLTHYYSLGAATICDRCKQNVEQARDAAAAWTTFGRAVVFGIGAAIAGAVLYYAVLAALNLEIGLIAIVIGYMVGYAVRRGSRGWGGMRFQILALTLTYFSVGLAYFPLVLDAARNAAARSATSVQRTAEAPAVAPRRAGAVGPLIGVGLILAFCFALPVMVVAGSLPTGLISAVIIGVGMRQAWKMTAAAPFEIYGPYQVGSAPAATG